MITDRLDVPVADLPVLIGWTLKPEGLCRAERCVPFAAPAPSPAEVSAGPTIDLRAVADRLGMAVVADEAHHLWAIGPESSGHVLESAQLPEIVLPDLDGHELDLAELRGRKLVLMAWASW